MNFIVRIKQNPAEPGFTDQSLHRYIHDNNLLFRIRSE